MSARMMGIQLPAVGVELGEDELAALLTRIDQQLAKALGLKPSTLQAIRSLHPAGDELPDADQGEQIEQPDEQPDELAE